MATIGVVAAVLALVALLVACARVALRAAPGAGALRDGPAAAGTPRRDLPSDLAAPAGRLVLLQLSSAFSAACRDTRAVLGDVAAEHPGVLHRDVDLAARPELVRLLAVADTPTTLLVDARGVELLRVSGVPRRASLARALTPHLSGSRPDGDR